MSLLLFNLTVSYEACFGYKGAELRIPVIRNEAVVLCSFPAAVGEDCCHLAGVSCCRRLQRKRRGHADRTLTASGRKPETSYSKKKTDGN